LQDDANGNTWVLNSKQGFQDCEIYAKLEEWLGRKTDEYWDTNYDCLNVVWVYDFDDIENILYISGCQVFAQISLSTWIIG
jgi:hypothetical protein